jgi:hypothetical protein
MTKFHAMVYILENLPLKFELERIDHKHKSTNINSYVHMPVAISATMY